MNDYMDNEPNAKIYTDGLCTICREKKNMTLQLAEKELDLLQAWTDLARIRIKL